MPLAFLIDGYNLVHALGLVRKKLAPKELATARRRLLDFLHERLEPRASAVTVVFDADRRPRHVPAEYNDGNLTVRFADRGQEADDTIEALLAQHPAPRRLVVVSDDRRLRDAAGRRQARSLGCQELLDHLERPAAPAQSKAVPARQASLSADEVQTWLNEFRDVEIPNEFRDFLDPPQTED
jgi:predicted RNA-binding protein with PIN domain